MCEPRKDGEPWGLYALRYAVELVDTHAHSVLAVLGFAAAVFLYADLRSLILAQTESYRQISNELRELNVRVSNIERLSLPTTAPKSTARQAGATLAG